MTRSGPTAFLFSLIAFIWCAHASTAAEFTPVMIKGHPAHPTRLLAKVKTGAHASTHADALTRSGLRAIRGYDLVPGLVVLDVDSKAHSMTLAAVDTSDTDVQIAVLEARISSLRASGLFEYVEPNYLIFADATPNDSGFTDGMLWGLRNTGQLAGTSGVDIDAVRAWDITKGSHNVIVAVIDTGIRYTHRELSAQMWRNPAEIAGNNRDDDGNGYIDDVYGINTVADTGDPMDDDGHGTHVAGTIGAAANNGHPHVGVAWNVRLMALKFLAASGGGETADAIECISYAVSRGARILNASWGGGPRSQALHDAILAARHQGVLFVAAAGNDGGDNDATPHFPANYDLENIVSVAAINRNGLRPYFSNYGATTVDLGAPGVSIYSTVTSSDTSYAVFQGTSMATPHVSGVAALVLAQYPDISVVDLRDRVLNTTTATPSLQGVTVTGGRLNAFHALTAVGDGQIELAVAPRTGVTLFHGRATPIRVRVTDLVGVLGATVSGAITGGGTLNFLDDGVAPDAVANDGWYAATLSVPNNGAELVLRVHASAPGKTAAEMSLTYPLQHSPPNDDFADRIVFTVNNGSVTTSTHGGTLEAGEPAVAGNVGGASVWWSWTAPVDIVATFETSGSDFDTLLGVFTGGSVNALTEIASNDDISAFNLSSRVTFAATAGTSYQIVVDGWGGQTGNVRLTLETPIPPANDDFGDRVPLIGTAAHASGTTVNATREQGEPSPAESDGGGTVWWSWTAPFTGTATASVSSTSYPWPVVAIYTGSNVSDLQRVPTRGDQLSFQDESTAVFLAEAGTAYHLAVAAARLGAEAPFALSLSLTPGPVNDRFADRIAAHGVAFSVTGSNLDATPEKGEPSHGDTAGGVSLWWSWTAPADGSAILTTAGSSFDTVLAVYAGEELAVLNQIASNDDSGNSTRSRVRFDAVDGTTYQIAVDGAYAGTGGAILNLSLVDPPANDHFSNRTLVSGRTVSATGNDAAATLEPGEPVQGTSSGGTTLWWSWTAPSTGTATVFTSDYNRPLAIFTGGSLDTLEPVFNSERPSDFDTRYRFRAIAGTVYQIVVDSRTVALTGDFTLNIDLAGAAANDLFIDRTALIGTSLMVPGSNVGATVEPAEPSVGHVAVGGRASVWWTWMAPADGTVLLTATNATFVPLLAVFTGASLPALERVKSTRGEDTGEGTFNFTALAGTTYQIAVDRDYRPGGSFTFGLTLVSPPANDDFVNRASLAGSAVQLSGHNIGATPEAGELQHDSRNAAASVWWTWTAPTGGSVVVTATGAEERFSLSVYTGTSFQNLSAIALTPETVQRTTRLSFSAIAGATYQIAIDNGEGMMGQFALELVLNPPPVNDGFSGRTVIVGTNDAVSALNFGATREPGEPPPEGYNGPGGSLWWSWTATSSGALVVSTSESDVPAYLGVFSGAAISTLNQVATSLYVFADGSTGRSFSVTAGSEYHFAVTTALGMNGEIALSLTFLDPPSNDAFAARDAAAGASTSVTGRTLGATMEAGESIHSPYSLGSVWWSWTAPQNGTAVIGLFSNASTDQLMVFTGSALASLTPVLNNERSTPSSRWLFHVTQGVTYQIAVNATGNRAATFRIAFNILAGPPNDQFADRITVTGFSAQITGSNVHATSEVLEPLHHYGGNYSSVWWTWTAPASGRAVLRATNRLSGTIAIYAGSSFDTLQSVASVRATTPQVVFDAVAGSTYQIAVDGTNGTEGDIALELVLVDRPINDAFADRTVIVGATATATGTNLGASGEPGEPIGGAGVWWTWTAPASGRAILSARRSGMLVWLEAFSGDTLSELTRLARSDYSSGAADPTRIAFSAAAGATYQIAATGYSGAMGDITLDLLLVDPPPNDAFATGTEISGTAVSVTGSNLGAQFESAEPAHGGHWHLPFASVWWTWTAPSSGRVVIAVAAEDFEPVLDVYVGQSLGGLNRIATRTGASAVSLAFDAMAGVSYKIVVDGYARGMGALSLDLALVLPPANDQVANPSTISGLPGTVIGTNRGAIAEASEPRHEFYIPGASVWWAWTAPTDGVIAVSTAGSDFDTLLRVYSSDEIETSTWIAQNDDDPLGGGGSRLVFRADAGRTYLIAVDGNYGATGNIVLNLSKTSAPPNDLPTHPAPVTPDGVVAIGSNIDATSGGVDLALNDGSPSIWWSFTPGFTGTVTVSTAGSEIGTHLGVYQRDDLNRWIRVNYQDYSEDGVTSLQDAPVVAGVPCFIVVDGKRGAMGTIRLRVTTGAPTATFIRMSAESVQVDSSVILTADVSGTGLFDYQWALNGENLSGATDASLHLASAQVFNSGQYTVRVSNAHGFATSTALRLEIEEPPPSSARLSNLSTRALALTSDNVLIPGFVIAGPGNKQLLIRAVGPTLAGFGVPGTLPDPLLILKGWNGDTYGDMAANDDWGTNANATDIVTTSDSVGAFLLAEGSLDAALLVELEPGQYTVATGDATGASGVAMVELYDADAEPDSSVSRLVNISNRGYVGTGADVMIPGFAISSEGAKTVLLRAVGPKLADFGVAGFLADPNLTVYRTHPETGASEPILANDNWGENGDATDIAATAAQVGAFELDPGSKDAAFVITLLPGVYTVHASGSDGGTGVALVEIYVVE